ncbi:MAG: MlaE family ABC transporter permease [Gemmatimonadota bacterium]|nr:ABC transporter permease [Gemmatimonadota bacterium]
MTTPGDVLRRTTGSFSVPVRATMAVFRPASNLSTGLFRGVGTRLYFGMDCWRALVREPATYLPELVRHMKTIGVDSVPLTIAVAAFIGSVIALQTRYQIFPGIQLSVVPFISRQMITLEMAPLLTGLVLTGRVGAKMTAELGTMRVTEQIDALETLAYDPVAFLVVPRVLAAVVMLPVLTIVANAVGLLSATFTSIVATDLKMWHITEGMRLAFDSFQITYGLIKAFFFGGAISFLSSYEGYHAGAGAEGVGSSTAKAVVIGCVAVLILDSLTATLLAPFLQG